MGTSIRSLIGHKHPDFHKNWKSDSVHIFSGIAVYGPYRYSMELKLLLVILFIFWWLDRRIVRAGKLVVPWLQIDIMLVLTSKAAGMQTNFSKPNESWLIIGTLLKCVNNDQRV